MKDEITLLREENKRLNTIIYVLTEKLQETETLLYAYLKNNIGINNVVGGTLENKVGINERLYAYEKSNVGINNFMDDTIENKVGINNGLYAYDKSNIGIDDVVGGIPENKVGINKINIGMLMGELKAVMNKCSAISLNNTAKTLVQLHTNLKCSQKDLMKVTNLSLDGIAKHIKALKNRNLIIKVAFQQYILSDEAIKMLEAARV